MDARTAAVLLDEFGKLPDRIERPQTFMEIAGYPHYENVCSNFLAFFFDPEEAHGLGSLFLDAVAGAVDVVEGGEGIGGNVSVEREVTTGTGNRIDLLITSDSHAILIENKIFAGLGNPFVDYATYLGGLTNESGDAQEAKMKILLTLEPTSKGREWGFVNLAYPEFVGRVRSLLGYHVSDADTRYLTIMLDFLNTLENLQEGSRMNREFIELLNERREEVESFFAEITAFKDELRSKVRETNSLIYTDEYTNVRQFLWRPKTGFYDLLAYDIRVSGNLKIRLLVLIGSSGWSIEIELREGNLTELRSLLTRLEIPFGDVEYGKHLPHPQHFAYDEDLSLIAPVVQDLVDKIATARVPE